VPIPEKALHLSEAEGRYRPLCFTNFEPHFNPRHLLDTLVLGGSRWEVRMVEHDYTHELFTYGYQDTRPSYHGVGGDREIHLRIDNLRSGEIRVCGYLVKNALSRVEFYFDENYPFPATSTSNTNLGMQTISVSSSTQIVYLLLFVPFSVSFFFNRYSIRTHSTQSADYEKSVGGRRVFLAHGTAQRIGACSDTENFPGSSWSYFSLNSCDYLLILLYTSSINI
jgi:hypothetical protein